jgi:hypothetical protein
MKRLIYVGSLPSPFIPISEENEGRFMKITIIFILICLLALNAYVLADPGVPQTAESQGFVISTNMQALGTVTETDSLAWRIKNDDFPDKYGGLDNPLFLIDAAEYSMTYSENTVADQGLVTYTKQGLVDTQAMVEPQSNVEMDKVVEFIGLDTGRMVSAEEQVLDGAGTAIPTEWVFVCPFASGSHSVLPTFCNIVQEGSSVDLTLGSLATRADNRFVTALQASPTGWDDPVSDQGVASGYRVTLTGIGDVSALGSANAYLNIHLQEARGINVTNESKSEDLVYSEDTTASGEISLFSKAMSYTSKLTGLGPEIPPED